MAKQPSKLYTIGYEGRNAEEFVGILTKAGVKTLVDCRIRPQSRKPGMSKTKLAERLRASGISYAHEVDLGTPKEIMKTFRETGFYDWDAYNKFLKQQGDTLFLVAEWAKADKVCFMCFEADAGTCHRRFVALEVAELTGQAIENL